MTTLQRNNKHKELVPNGRKRHGQADWHNADCQIEDYGFNNATPPYRAIWCATHGQWAHEHPIRRIFVFEDGTEMSREL